MKIEESGLKAEVSQELIDELKRKYNINVENILRKILKKEAIIERKRKRK